MKLGQAMYEQQQAQAQPEAGAGETEAEARPAEEDVVDAEFSEVDDEQKPGQ